MGYVRLGQLGLQPGNNYNFFPIYFTEITRAPPMNGTVHIAGRYFVNTALYNYALAAAYLIVAILMPILTAIADARGNKKKYMRFLLHGSNFLQCTFFLYG